jgi:hypothetical protein
MDLFNNYALYKNLYFEINLNKIEKLTSSQQYYHNLKIFVIKLNY